MLRTHVHSTVVCFPKRKLSTRPFSSSQVSPACLAVPGRSNGAVVRVQAGNTLSSVQQQVPPQVLYTAAGILGVAGLAAALIFGAKAMQKGQDAQPEQAGVPAGAQESLERKDAVLVFGSTGKMGVSLVQQLLSQNRSVVAAARSSEKASHKLEGAGLTPGRQPNGQVLVVESGTDITTESSLLREELWRGVSQVAIAVGPIFGRQADGQMGYTDNMTSERVDAEGVSNIVAAAKQKLQCPSERRAEVVMPLASAEDLSSWERLDDVIMGGQSSSALEVSASGRGATWSGQLVIEGGGFCGTRAKGLNLDLSGYDGVALRVKGDGQMYKINIKTAERGDDPESTYAATFETTGDWQTIYIPFREFVPVVRARYDPEAPPLNPATVRQIGFRLSRFDFNNLANPKYMPGPFSLEIEGGIRAFKDVRPAVVLVSSSAVERNAIICDDAEARKKDIPIVQLNPGGILNYKYMGETALRASGLPYAVVRPVGLTTEEECEPFVLEASQGDKISGKISRAEAAAVVAAALQTPTATGKTLEVRRSEAAANKGKKSSGEDLERLFLGAVEDWHRPRRALPPLPAAVPPPPPPDEERVKEILANPEVQAAARRARDREAGEKLERRAGHRPDMSGKVTPQAEAREWIRNWRARTLEEQLPAEEQALTK